ncbi:hydantoin racemase [Pseudomassariella vexata]|uniref:Hydantoin racemase n=1 Tax=Pseudomassariella vexata TaxID=1141098 RepID=A0A1Y2EEM4_9PEZI|nr:hydantoin racemase [Pseudomassariella vexata]ORY70028.1 hydantoin racemase [Pseudomassariella vexata]
MAQPLPSVTGTSTHQISILLINPNSTCSMTLSCLRSLHQTLPPTVTVTGFTAPPTAPTAIEGRLDAVLSAAECVRALRPHAYNYDAFLVACFSAHPLIPALREEYSMPCIGIMEAALYASRMCGDKLGVLCTSARSKVLHEQSISATYGLGAFSAGTEAADVAVLELETKPREEVYASLVAAARRLVEEKGADCVCLGCAGMTGMREVCQEAVEMDKGKVMVVDGVTIGIHFLIGLVREGLTTAKAGAYKSSRLGRENRGQMVI